MRAKDHPLHRTYEGMIERCYYPKATRYHRYGGRGIAVCERWSRKSDKKAVGFWNFVSDMGPKPGPEYSLDRMDSDGDYCPENCRWATVETQTVNKDQHRGERTGGAKLTAKRVVAIKKRLGSGEAITQVAKAYNVSNSTVADIKHGRTWAHVT